tara:strand:+ start:408 stop:770 length:363 start_codon:yes stop_codon:yes gene_type:complete
LKELDANYVPIDFDSYSLEDKNTILNKKANLKDDDKIWRVTSLTAFVDQETNILLLPVPETKRKVKIMDTKYSLSTIKDLLDLSQKIEDDLQVRKNKENKRFEDKTTEEIDEDMRAKRTR